MTRKQRLDVLLVDRGLVESRSLAQRLIMAGEVRVAGQIIVKPSTPVAPETELEIVQKPPYVSRGGEKLAAALGSFPVQVNGRVCADVGASTGGFTDCLLQNGAHRVYAIDVGHGILHWKLRQDERVSVMERTNARFLDILPEPVSLVTIDASFISLKVLLPVVKNWLISNSDVIALIKPQYEAGRREASRGSGVIRSPEVHSRVLNEVLAFADQQDFGIKGLIRSPLKGPKGNAEFLAWLCFPSERKEDISAIVAEVVLKTPDNA